MSIRIAALDGLRGIAVMGILLMNVNAFAMPFAAYDNPAAFGPTRPADVVLWAAEFLAIDGKMRAIFSALFGASLLLVAERAETAGRGAARTSHARLVTLLLFGLAHACLVWMGDILVLYAIVGVVAFPLRRLPVERLLVLSIMLLSIGTAILAVDYYGLEALRHAATAPGANPGDVALWRQVLDDFGPPSPTVLADDLALHRGPWRVLAASLTAGEPGTIRADLYFSGSETLGLMLLGMAGLKSGFLGGSWTRAAYARTARIAYAVGLPPLVLIAFVLVARGFPPLLTITLTDCVAMPFRWAVAVGHAALILRWLSGAPTPLTERVQAAGRMAFSNYLGTSIVMTALFDGWGLGLYGRVERWMLPPFVFAMWVFMLAWSKPWLARFPHGPLEWLWRRLAWWVAGRNRASRAAS